MSAAGWVTCAGLLMLVLAVAGCLLLIALSLGDAAAAVTEAARAERDATPADDREEVLHG